MNELDTIDDPWPDRDEVLGRCYMRFGGIIENACEIEIMEIKKRAVRVRYRIGEDPPDEVELELRGRLHMHFHVKAASFD